MDNQANKCLAVREQKKEINLLRDTYHFTSFVSNKIPKEDKQNQKTSFWDDQTPLCISTYNIVDCFVQHFFASPAKALLIAYAQADLGA